MRIKRIGGAGLLGSLAVVGAALAVATPASAAERVYWGNTLSKSGAGSIDFATVGGTGGVELDTSPATVEEPFGVALDPAAGLVFWANNGGETPIAFAHMNDTGGGNLDTNPLAKGSFKPDGIAIDTANGRVYWADEGHKSIDYANLNDTGGGGEVPVTGVTVETPTGLTIDPVSETIYWINKGTEIDYASLDGSGAKKLKTESFGGAEGLALDPANERIYWADSTNERIDYANLNEKSPGGHVNTTKIGHPRGVAINPSAGVIYWANAAIDKISFADLNESGTEGVVAEQEDQHVDGPGFPALLLAPVGLSATTLTGNGSTVGATLTCKQGVWAPDLADAFDFLAPQGLAFSWSVNGTAIAGATSSSIVAGSAGSYTCSVTASNEAGATAASSAAVTITGPLVAAPAPPVLLPTNIVAVGQITGLSISPHKFHAATRGASIASTHTGVTVSYSDSQAATTTFTVLMPVKGFKHGSKCLAKRPTGHGRVARCTLYRPLGTFTHRDAAGHNSFRFSGRVKGHRLAAGSYRLQAVPALAGRVGSARTATFTILA